MITSWNWVLLTDFASFKPTNLAEVSILLLLLYTVKAVIFLLLQFISTIFYELVKLNVFI